MKWQNGLTPFKALDTWGTTEKIQNGFKTLQTFLYTFSLLGPSFLAFGTELNNPWLSRKTPTPVSKLWIPQPIIGQKANGGK